MSSKSQKKKKQCGREKVFEEITAGGKHIQQEKKTYGFEKFSKSHRGYYQLPHPIPHRHILFKLLKTKDKEKTLKTINKKIHYLEIMILITINFLEETNGKENESTFLKC